MNPEQNLPTGFMHGYRARALYHIAARSLERFVESREPLYLDVAKRAIEHYRGMSLLAPRNEAYYAGVEEADRHNRVRGQRLDKSRPKIDFYNTLAAALEQ